jgi:hypothetical protein
MNVNRISATLPQADQEAVLAAIESIAQKLPFLIDLTTQQRKGLMKVGPKSHSFIKGALEVAVQNGNMLPASFDLQEMRKDMDLFEHLTTVRIALSKLNNLVEDTTVQAGAEAYAAARAVYALTKTPLATPALRTTAGDLGRNFKRKRAA